MRGPTPAPRTPGRRRGLALVAVLAQLTIIFMVWSLANRQSASTIGLEEALGRRADRQQGSLTALAVGLGLLETGVPAPEKLSGSPPSYRCFVEYPRGDGSTARYTLGFEQLDAAVSADPPTSRWAVEAAPYDASTDTGIEGPITTFAGGSGSGTPPSP